jgi:hypothetical protein
MTFDLYVWSSPRDLDEDRAEELLENWHAAGADPASSPFEPSTDIGWFCRELIEDAPDLEVVTDATPRQTRVPIWMSGTDEPPARLVAIRVSPNTPPDTLEAILGLAMKYDLVLFDARSRRLHHPLAEMSAYADATFWPAGAIQAAVAGLFGGAVAVGAWILSIPIVSGVVAVIGGFMFVMAVFTFINAGRSAMKTREPRR